MSSIETTLARYEARAADEAWSRHRVNCPQCARAGQRGGPVPCEAGLPILQAKLDAAAELKRNRDLDRQPNPDQEPLF